MSGHPESTERPAVGVLADDERRDRVVDAVAEAGGEPLVEEAATAADPAFVVAVGERALRAAVGDDPATPVLPVEAGKGVASTPFADLPRALSVAVAGEAERTERALLSVRRGDDDPVPALFDVTLVTTEPARISEYRLADGGERVSQFRADGAVVATPAGTHGYAAAADGPLLAPGTGVAAVVPLAPFVTDREQWVLPDDDLSVTVVRDEGAVSLYADDEHVGEVPPHTTVTVARDGSATLLSTPVTRPFF